MLRNGTSVRCSFGNKASSQTPLITRTSVRHQMRTTRTATEFQLGTNAIKSLQLDGSISLLEPITMNMGLRQDLLRRRHFKEQTLTPWATNGQDMSFNATKSLRKLRMNFARRLGSETNGKTITMPRHIESGPQKDNLRSYPPTLPMPEFVTNVIMHAIRWTLLNSSSCALLIHLSSFIYSNNPPNNPRFVYMLICILY